MAHEQVRGGTRTHPLASAIATVRSIPLKLKLAARDRSERAIRATATSSVEERQSELVVFYTHYEELVETLCDAAQFGPSANLEREYARLRSWVQENYPPVRRYVVAFLRYDASDAEQGLLFGHSADAFEALAAPPTLEDFLKADDGRMIFRIHRTREALMLYGEHLRRLASRR